MNFKQGDFVRVIEREVTPSDIKDGSFYKFYCGLVGTVDRLYDTEICVKVELDSLPEEIRKRHLDIQNSMKKKWLNGVSNEMRNRLTPSDKKFDLSYTILVQLSDLEKAEPGDTIPPVSKNIKPPKADIKPADVEPKSVEPPKADVKPADVEPKSVEPPKADVKPAEAEPAPKPISKPTVRMSDPLPPKAAVKDLAASEGLTPAELAYLEERKNTLEL